MRALGEPIQASESFVVTVVGAVVEVVLDGPLGPARDDADVVRAGLDGLLDHVLDYGTIENREHLLRHALRCGEKAEAKAGRRNHDLQGTLPPGGLGSGRCSSIPDSAGGRLSGCAHFGASEKVRPSPKRLR